MTITDARKILGLASDEDPRPHLADFKTSRDNIAAKARTAPNSILAVQYQTKLIEFDQALAAVQNQLQASGVVVPPLSSQSVRNKPSSPRGGTHADRPASRPKPYLAWVLILFVGAAGATWIYFKNEQTQQNQRLNRITALEIQGSLMVENRRWQEAGTAFAEIESLSPGSELALRGRRSIEAGMTEEQTQFVGYWIGQATAALEAGRFDEALSDAQKVRAKFPEEKDVAGILEKIAVARVGQSRSIAIAAAREALDQRKWSAAIASAQKILLTTPDDSDAKSILTTASSALEKFTADQAKAAELLKMAIARDQGQFDPEALEWLREASSLAPGNLEIAAHLEKLSCYSRTLRVPGDFATPAEALAMAHDRDRIVLGAGTWKGPLFINAAVELQGADFTETRVECTPENGSAITIGPDAKGARISGITFRHESFAVGSERFSVALVRGGSATFVDCRFTEASGHGLAVIEGGQASVSRCRFADNGWNGASAIGQGSTLDIRNSESLNNFEHGIESWDGAAVTLISNRCEGNSRNGIHTDNGLASACIEDNQLIANREFGLVLDSAGAGKISGNTARSNFLGGFVIRATAAKIPVTRNQATLNQGPGLILEKDLTLADYTSNSISANSGQQILTDTDLSAATDGEVSPPRATIIVEPAPLKLR